MDDVIEQMRQDLARGGYATSTRARYCAGALALVTHVGKPIARITREEIRGFVDVVMAREVSASTKGHVLSALPPLPG